DRSLDVDGAPTDADGLRADGPEPVRKRLRALARLERTPLRDRRAARERLRAPGAEPTALERRARGRVARGPPRAAREGGLLDGGLRCRWTLALEEPARGNAPGAAPGRDLRARRDRARRARPGERAREPADRDRRGEPLQRDRGSRRRLFRAPENGQR